MNSYDATLPTPQAAIAAAEAFNEWGIQTFQSNCNISIYPSTVLQVVRMTEVAEELGLDLESLNRPLLINSHDTDCFETPPRINRGT